MSNYMSILLFGLLYESNVNVSAAHPAIEITLTQITEVIKGCCHLEHSVMFHFMFVHYTFSSVWVAEWPPFVK